MRQRWFYTYGPHYHSVFFDRNLALARVLERKGGCRQLTDTEGTIAERCQVAGYEA